MSVFVCLRKKEIINKEHDIMKHKKTQTKCVCVLERERERIKRTEKWKNKTIIEKDK